MKYIFHSTGKYLGFIVNTHFFSRDNAYLAWIENDNVWNGFSGEYVGKVTEQGGYHYILRERFIVRPIPKISKPTPIVPDSPHLPSKTPSPITLPIETEDAYV